MAKFELIAFDADDTLWHNETLYQETRNRVVQLLSGYAPTEQFTHMLDETEERNIRIYGYGAKSYILSMVETAIAVTMGQVQAGEIEQILEYGKAMINAEIQLLEGVETALNALTKQYPLMIITKGDLIDQEAKLARSGLAGYFQHVEVVGSKTVETYRKILNRYQVQPEQFLMVGNALRSDILPVLQAGGYAVYIPYAQTWAHESEVDQEIPPERYFTLGTIDQLPYLVASLTEH